MATLQTAVFLTAAALIAAATGLPMSQRRYTPDWDSLDQRPLPSWYDEAKVGVFLHWGVYSVPACRGEWFWAYWKGHDKYITDFMNKNYPPGFTYQDFAEQFQAELFDADDFVGTIAKSGAQYLTLTTKHHEGYTLFPSNYSFNWNSMDVGPKKDLVRLIRDKATSSNMKFGAYYSLYEWFHPLYVQDRANHFTTQKFVDTKMIPEMKQLVNDYHPDIIWVDGDWEANDTYFRSREFLAWLYNDSPVKDTVVVNDRWGKGIPCHHGDFYTCKDNYKPGKLIKHKWESARTVDKNSWGYRRELNLEDLRTSKEIVGDLVETVACGGNLALNVGPNQHGRIPEIFAERLKDMGDWLKINGEAIYGTKPWDVARNDSVTGDLWYTTKKGVLYATLKTWPKNNLVHLGCVPYRPNLPVSMIGTDAEVGVHVGQSGELLVTLPDKILAPCDWAWTLKIPMPTNTECVVKKQTS